MLLYLQFNEVVFSRSRVNGSGRTISGRDMRRNSSHFGLERSRASLERLVLRRGFYGKPVECCNRTSFRFSHLAHLFDAISSDLRHGLKANCLCCFSLNLEKFHDLENFSSIHFKPGGFATFDSLVFV